MDQQVDDASGAVPPPAGLSPGWTLQRDLPCPTCRYNLRMLHAPRCPECGSVFRWQTLLHIQCPRCGASLREVDGGACPECGLNLQWDALLNAADSETLRRQFEYAQRGLPSALGRALYSLASPARFWHSLPLEAPPVPARLRLFQAVCPAIFLLGFLLAVAAHWLPAGGPYSDLLLLAAIGTLAPPFATAAAMPIFSATLARFRIRREQLLRCAAYGCAGQAWTGVLLSVIALAALVVNVLIEQGYITSFGGIAFQLQSIPEPAVLLRSLPPALPNPLASLASAVVALITIMVGVVWWSRYVYTALRRNLRLDGTNTFALLASTQLIAWLFAAVLALRIPTVLWMISRLLLP